MNDEACPKCGRVLRGMRGQLFSAVAVDREGQCYRFDKDAFTCLSKPIRCATHGIGTRARADDHCDRPELTGKRCEGSCFMAPIVAEVRKRGGP